ncbi:permease [Herbaspirillum rubrisubalbicans]|jgi:lipopolysaccharide export system permease protein|uniref:Permease n=2 Tax=Herbaspirillum rubrisubalbicans TaxID=80842 RepID=A0ABX9C3L5_9BURK|nr:MULTISPECIES: LPS export ABC transporter permease LptG [Herbaspirillum]ALU90288.1 permease transmembrane protein [Herbaspirillum rubrisubalbicans M1]MCP1573475.1 lipopolysaccharide export system permease protein [Herbaspirillum rubrisubalbicans]NQE47774.1 permease [Herbaspirillum rubrisubalbicans]QJQ01968.1 LPS export ABC transporter permease LptG [Herbaspirillum rubrisubalbicans Os34]RAM65067.1 permease [Herbaspirillum rubrisubalbicans]
MRVIQRYFTTEITRSVFFALAAFLALFAFFEMMGQLEQVGRNGYKLQQAVFYVLMGLPGNVYELMPTAVLIGTIYTLSQLAARSEFTIMRVSSMSTGMAAKVLLRIGVGFAVITIIFGELIAPKASEWAEKLRLQAQGSSMSSQFRSGMWAKDVIKDHGLEGNVTGSRFINIQTVQPDGRIEGVKLYELDTDFHMARMVTAKSGMYEGDHQWVLSDVVQSDFTGDKDRKITEPVKTMKLAQMKLVSEVTPEILSVLFADPDRMSAYDLLAYTKHLEANNQRTDRYEIAFWKKIVYPLSIFVMLALALPFAYLHFRAGGVSLKIFTGIMIGVCFQLINSLFSHLGLLNTWPAFMTAALPSLLFMVLAIGSLWWVERT